MVRFSEEQVLRATLGRKLSSGSEVSYESICTDTRALLPGCLFVALHGERFDGHQFVAEAADRGARGAVVERGKGTWSLPRSFAIFEVESTLKALGDLARFHRGRFEIPIGAVTGSNGKTTTKEMVHAILATRGIALKTEGNLNNEVGVPLTLFRLDPSHVAAVIEMGMSHPGEIGRLTAITQPDAGVITSVHPAHLQDLGSIEGVAAAKGELFRRLGKSATAVVNLDDPLIVAQLPSSGSSVLTFGETEAAQVRLTGITLRPPEGLNFVLEYRGGRHPVRLSFLGRHNARNAAAAFALAIALGYQPQECVRGLELARPYPGRLNVLQAPGRITILDDSYNANPGSMAAALETLRDLVKGEGRAVAVVGDMLELGLKEESEHAELGEQVAQVAKLAAFFGPRSAQAHRAAAMGEMARHFEDVPSLLQWLTPQLHKGDVVLVKASRGMRLERVVQALIGAVAKAKGC